MAQILFITVSAIAAYLSILSTIFTSFNIYVSLESLPRRRWKRIIFNELNLLSAVTCLAYLGTSHALLFYSIFWNRRLVEVLVVWFARVHLARQADFFRNFLPCLGSYHISLMIYIRWAVMCVSVICLGCTILVTYGLAVSSLHVDMHKLYMLLIAGESLEFSLIFLYVIWVTRWRGNLLRYLSLVLGLPVSLLGFACAATLYCVMLWGQLKSDLAFLVLFAVNVLGLVRTFCLGIVSFSKRLQDKRAHDRGDWIGLGSV